MHAEVDCQNAYNSDCSELMAPTRHSQSASTCRFVDKLLKRNARRYRRKWHDMISACEKKKQKH